MCLSLSWALWLHIQRPYTLATKPQIHLALVRRTERTSSDGRRTKEQTRSGAQSTALPKNTVDCFPSGSLFRRCWGPRSKLDRLIYNNVLVYAGMTLMIEAQAGKNQSALSRARQFRNGLMLAMLAFHPIRLKNFAALLIGGTFRKINGTWWIVLPASDTKEKDPTNDQSNQFCSLGLTSISIFIAQLWRGQTMFQKFYGCHPTTAMR